MGKFFNDISEGLKHFIIQNNTNPILWIFIFFGGLAVFYLTYKALHKER